MDMRENEFHKDWIKAINSALKSDVTLQGVGIIGGGSINDARRINTSDGAFFVKLNEAEPYPGMFEAEAKGLAFLAEHSSFEVPKPIATGQTEDRQWIIMEIITSGTKKPDYWEVFGRRMAEMHKHTNDSFGLDYNNYIGSLPQYNTPSQSWPEFFVEQRLQPQLKMAKDKSLASSEIVRLFEKLFSRAERYFPNELPAAIHGDLWTGNFMTTASGDATIFDPSVSYGHREMDIGMSRLFGSFDAKFYAAYNEVYPMQSGWEQRVNIANLYPLMAHVNIFGGSYTSQVINILRKYA
jgi:fructosamine-3-kinase